MVEAGLDLLIVLFLSLECCSRRHPLPCQLVSAFENTFIFIEVAEEILMKKCTYFTHLSSVYY